ncbi:unnamed protein product [Cylicocyclus nassatus]|uniref:Uncharacterized protein n=1 Tax=Cylicocyclus nassatus TaxID=53992 RepID=A0AA36GVT4_CYLNA|nr:unnamed protein product [Cylicocyclus nassatus]
MLPGEKFTVLSKSDVVFMSSKATVWRRETKVLQRDGDYFYGNETFVDCLAVVVDGSNSKCDGFVPLASNQVRAPRQASFYRLGLALRNVSPNDNGVYIGGVINRNNSFQRIPGCIFKLNLLKAVAALCLFSCLCEAASGISSIPKASIFDRSSILAPFKPKPARPVSPVRPVAQTIYAGKVFMLPNEKFTVLSKSDVVFMDSKATVWMRHTKVLQNDGEFFNGNETFVDCLAVALDGPNSKCDGFVPVVSNQVRAPRQASFYRLGLALRNVSPNDNGIYIGGVYNCVGVVLV